MAQAFRSVTKAFGHVASRGRSHGVSMFDKAMEHNLQQLRDETRGALADTTTARLLDLGCWDGAHTVTYAPGVEMHGAEGSETAVLEAKRRGVDATQVDLNEALPWQDDYFDAVTSNQVIEHLSDTDRFTSEAFRVLKPGGTAVVSTENMSSWHNLAALVLGWQAFSLTNISERSSGVGNPIALSRNDEPRDKGWQHLRIFSHRGLRELFEVHGFVDVKVLGSGYYPLPTKVAELDPRHAAFITVVAKKPRTVR